jgi:glycine cleavage system H lipoate-binding protein
MDDRADYDISQYASLTNPWHQDPTAYLDRYYTLYHKPSTTEQYASVYVRQSPNKICVLGISQPPANAHSVRMHTSLVNNKVKTDTILCDLLDEAGQVVQQVRAEMEGKLLELNSQCNTLLFNGHHMDTGFIAIIMPKVEDTKVQLKEFTVTASQCRT